MSIKINKMLANLDDEIGEKDSRKRDLGALGREGLSEMMTFGQNPDKGARRVGGGWGRKESCRCLWEEPSRQREEQVPRP